MALIKIPIRRKIKPGAEGEWLSTPLFPECRSSGFPARFQDNMGLNACQRDCCRGARKLTLTADIAGS
jgi:hypothetical protein